MEENTVSKTDENTIPETEENAASRVEELEKSDPKDAQTQFELAQHYYKGSGTMKNYNKAFEWYEKAALQGHAGAQFKLGQCYSKGHGTWQDPLKAAKWYEAAANSGHSQAAFTLAGMYFQGPLPKDLHKAKELYEMCREDEGKRNLYRINKMLGTELTTEEIRKKKAALEEEAKEGEGSSMIELAEWYRNGRHIPKDLKQSAYWAKLATDNNCRSGYRILGLIAEEEDDPAGAVEWYRKGAEKGSLDCKYCLGICFREGYGVKRDLKKAVALLKEASYGRTVYYSRYQVIQEYREAEQELEKLTGKKTADEKRAEPVSQTAVTQEKTVKQQDTGRYKEPVWVELLGIVAAVLLILLTVYFVKIGGGRYGNEAEIVLKGFKKTLAEIVCVGGIIGLSIGSLGLVTFSLFDTLGLGGFFGGIGGIAAVIMLGVSPVTKTIVIYAAAAVIVLMSASAVWKRRP